MNRKHKRMLWRIAAAVALIVLIQLLPALPVPEAVRVWRMAVRTRASSSPVPKGLVR